MDFTEIINSIAGNNLAARQYEKSGHGKFRDCITVCRNGRICFQRYCYGEAASLVCTLWANRPDEQGNISWDFSTSNYSGKSEAPKQLTGSENNNLMFDGKITPWHPINDLKTMPTAGLGWFRMLFLK